MVQYAVLGMGSCRPSLFKVTLLFFAKSRELTNISQTTITIPSSVTGQDIVDTVLAAYPQ